MTETEPLYSNRASLYDPIYSFKDYKEESLRLTQLLEQRGLKAQSEVLVVACGTGQHELFLKAQYAVTGTDKNPEMLSLARAKNPELEYFLSDMESLSLDKRYDALLCLFSSIGYVHGEAALRQTLLGFREALKAGGLVVIEPWILKSSFRPNHVSMQTYLSEELALCRQCQGQLDGDVADLTFHWLVTRKGQETEYFKDHHRMWFCSHELMTQAMEDAGFEVETVSDGWKNGRGLYIGRAR